MLEGLGLELPDAFAGDPPVLGDVLEGLRRAAVEPEAAFEDALHAQREPGEAEEPQDLAPDEGLVRGRRRVGCGGDRGQGHSFQRQIVAPTLAVAQVFLDVDRQPDEAPVVVEGAEHERLDPPDGVGRELKPETRVEALDRHHQPQRTLLDEVVLRKQAGSTGIAHREAVDQAHVVFDANHAEKEYQKLPWLSTAKKRNSPHRLL